jgi:hypothetical protein
MKFFVILSFLATTCFSVGWMLWCWHDMTSAGGVHDEMRPQQFADHAASVAFCIGRVVVATSLSLMVQATIKARD